MAENEVIEKFIDESKSKLFDIIREERSFIVSLCTISAAITAFSIPLFTLAFIESRLLLFAIFFFLITISIGTISLMLIFKYDNSRVTEMLSIALNIKNAENPEQKIQALEKAAKFLKTKTKQLYVQPLMAYTVNIGIVLFFLALLFGIYFKENNHFSISAKSGLVSTGEVQSKEDCDAHSPHPLARRIPPSPRGRR